MLLAVHQVVLEQWQHERRRRRRRHLLQQSTPVDVSSRDTIAVLSIPHHKHINDCVICMLLPLTLFIGLCGCVCFWGVEQHAAMQTTLSLVTLCSAGIAATEFCTRREQTDVRRQQQRHAMLALHHTLTDVPLRFCC